MGLCFMFEREVSSPYFVLMVSAYSLKLIHLDVKNEFCRKQDVNNQNVNATKYGNS